MVKKKCCKYCEELTYWDGYFCKYADNMFCENYIDGDKLEENSCDKYMERQGKFWLYEGAEF